MSLETWLLKRVAEVAHEVAWQVAAALLVVVTLVADLLVG